MKLKKSPKPFQIKLESIADDFLTDHIPTFFWQVGRSLLEHPCEGIFRMTGDVAQICDMKKKINKKIDITKDMTYPDQMYCLAGVLSGFLREMPKPILNYSDKAILATVFSRFRKVTDLPQTVIAVNLALRRVEPLRRRYLFFLLNLYYSISKKSDVNKMTFSKIGICVAPSFFSRELTYITTTTESIDSQIDIVTMLITLYPLISPEFEESKNVIKPCYNLTEEETRTILKNPANYNLGDIHLCQKPLIATPHKKAFAASN
ncbi:hypothetical protein EIN_051530 [Entamoeba invadens IP1]|uniref:hypothetical protein n=1 Tax=Entamoeba invadens IP1 TaxID=370355 RepID=UPI0002C3D645|nr:hypothetical protein EIN_051530 [Entamoeba invadens IP1]ELP92988.1 hypothetical protein EIN_051530 [Entamoeba invadens IP1]|eukprot:XP_004259759.1 hypothetical protein EIN_051530 [Entamoeba invadens IP1]